MLVRWRVRRKVHPMAETKSKTSKAPLVAPSMKIPFILLLLCFAAWGLAANLTDVLVSVFRSIFTMSNLQSSLVQSAYYGAYFLLALPAAFINAKFGFKAGVLTGLGLASVGGILFLPASNMLQYGAFLAALFTLAAGLSILETSANPFMLAMGDEQTATRRLNLAQAFNPIGANIGVLIGATMILPRLTPEAAKVIMSPEELVASQRADLQHVLIPYLGIAALLLVIWVLIAISKVNLPQAPSPSPSPRSTSPVQAARSAGCGATIVTATASSHSSSTWVVRPASGRSPSSTRWTSWASPKRGAAGGSRRACWSSWSLAS